MGVSEEIAASMRAANELFCASVIGRGELEALTRVYTRSAKILPPGAPLIEGAGEISSFWKQAIDSLGLTGAALRTIDAEVAGESVIEVGEATLTLASGQVAMAKYVVHWKQEDGAWKWHTDIWNMNV